MRTWSNQQGATLMSVLVGTAIAGILIAATTTMFTNTMRLQSGVRFRTNVDSTVSDLRLALRAHPLTCVRNFPDQRIAPLGQSVTVPSIRYFDPTANALSEPIVLAGRDGIQAIRLATVRQLSPSGITPRVFLVEVRFDFAPATETGVAPPNYRPVALAVAVDAGLNIQSCSLDGSGGGVLGPGACPTMTIAGGVLGGGGLVLPEALVTYTVTSGCDRYECRANTPTTAQWSGPTDTCGSGGGDPGGPE